MPIEEKVRRIATEIYRADDVYFEKRAKVRLEKFAQDGYGALPVCIARRTSDSSPATRRTVAPVLRATRAMRINAPAVGLGAVFGVALTSTATVPHRYRALIFPHDEDSVANTHHAAPHWGA